MRNNFQSNILRYLHIFIIKKCNFIRNIFGNPKILEKFSRSSQLFTFEYLHNTTILLLGICNQLAKANFNHKSANLCCVDAAFEEDEDLRLDHQIFYENLILFLDFSYFRHEVNISGDYFMHIC